MEFDVVVIGGGQAGLAMGHHLAQRDLRFVILDAEARVGDAWRRRWDGLRLFTRAKYDGLPGMAFPAPPDSFPTKDEVADYLEAYARRMALPIRTGVVVDGLEDAVDGAGFVVSAGDERIHAAQVVVATGAFRHPRIPAFATDLGAEIRQLHSSEFRTVDQLADGPVLVVGASNSGAEIALKVAARHRTILSGPDTGTLPRPESRIGALIDPFFWFLINRIMTVDTPMGRRVGPRIEAHGGPLERVWPADLAAAGVDRRYGRTIGVRDGRPLLDDGESVEVRTVIWSTGFRPDFNWVRLPVFDDDGRPRHVRGVVPEAPGLYFLGLPFLYSLASPLLGGVGRDAAHLATQIASRARGVEAGSATRTATAVGG
jgi:putative flavoprotein involved in K+ transport